MDDSEGTSVDQIADVVADLKAAVGSEICDRMINGYSSRDGRGFMDHHRREARAHPFALGWDDLVTGIAASRKAGGYILSGRAHFLLDSMSALKIAAKDRNYHELCQRLLNPRQYSSTVFEAFVYATYHSMGFPVSIVKETGLSSPDLRLVCEATEMFFECKSVEDKYQIEDNIWSTIEDRIARLLTVPGAGYRLSFNASRSLNGKDVEPIVGAARELIRRFPVESIANTSGCELKLKRIEGPGEVLELLDRSKRDGKGRIRFEMGWEDKSGANLEFTVLESFPFSDYKPGKALVEHLRSAAKRQLPKGAAGVVHLQIPYRISKLFLDVLDDARPLIEQELRRRPHVCAVVLTGRFLSEHVGRTHVPIETYHYVIPNFSSEHRLPGSFQLPGTCDIGDAARWFGTPDHLVQIERPFSPGATGTFQVSFFINEQLAQQKGLYLLRHCSGDGREQLSVWQSFGNFFRIEVVIEQFGRRSLDFDLNHLAIGVTHHMAFCWSEDGIRCAVDGEMVSV